MLPGPWVPIRPGPGGKRISGILTLDVSGGLKYGGDMDTPCTARAVVEALGGSVKLAERLKVNRTAVSNWMKDGFPKSRMPDLLRLAEEDGAAGVTLAVLLPMEAKYPERPAKAAPTDAQASAA
jgi:hypothetical protein